MDVDCWDYGSCKLCGCQTTHLQMCNKACDKPCYPIMMNRTDWKNFKKGDIIYVGGKYWKKSNHDGRPRYFKENTEGEYVLS